MYISTYRRRLHAVYFFFFAFLGLCAARLLYIQFFRSRYLAGIAQKQHNLYIELEPRRGTIFDCNLRPQALNIALESVYACPNSIPASRKASYADALAPILKVERSFLLERLGRPKDFVWLARKVTPEQGQRIKALALRGIDFIKESKRCYPNGYLASHIIGFAGLDNNGLEGVELAYDQYLKGEAGWMYMLRDARQKRLDLFDELVMPKDGYDIVLTIDEVIQYIAERELERACKTHRAAGGSIVVMDPKSGAVLAMANRGTYDLNAYPSASQDDRRNRAICDLYEPGSVFKIVTAAAALEEDVVTEDKRFFCENGAYRVASHILHDHHPNGWLTFSQVIEQSSNIGTTKVAQLLGPAQVYRYARLFGFGARTGIEMPGEIAGMLKAPAAWSKTSIGAVPIGQEVGTTTLQLASAIGALANDGRLMKPYIVRQIRDRYGVVIKDFQPLQVRDVVSPETAERVRSILVKVVEQGTGKLARVPGYRVGGKTGTAQKIDENGRYSHSQFTASFIGFAPEDEPLLAIAVSIDKPHPYYFGGVVAAPVFKNVCADVLRYLQMKRPAPYTVVASHETGFSR